MAITRRDPGQVLQAAFDDSTQSLRTTTASSGGGGSQEIVINQADDSIAIGDGSVLYTGTTEDGKHGLDVNVLNQIEVSNSGLKTGLQHYQLTVTDSATPLPQLSNQNAVTIRVYGSSNVYVGNSSVNAAQGYPLRQFESLQLDVQDGSSVQVYLICDPGNSCDVRLLALA